MKQKAISTNSRLQPLLNSNGMDQMNINLSTVTYILTATNPSTGE